MRYSVLFVVVGVSLLGSACSGSGDSGSKADADRSANQAASEQTSSGSRSETVQLTLVSGSPKEEMDAVYLEPLRKKHPQLEVTYIQTLKETGTTVPELIASGVKFDMYTQSRGGFEETMLTYGLQYDMSELIRKHGVNIGHLEPTAIESMKQMFDGKLYGLPVKMNSLLLFYNKALFDQFGVSYPKDGMTWSETFELANKLTRSDGQNRIYGIGSSGTGALLGWNPFSIPLVDDKKRMATALTDERWRTLLETVFLNPLMTQTYKEAGKIPDWASFSKDRNVAMLLYTAAAPLALTKEFSTLDWDMVSLPVHPQYPNVGSQVSPNYFGITSISEKKDAAMQAIQFWTSLDYFVENSKGGTLMASSVKEVRDALGSESPFPNQNWGAVTYYPFAQMAPNTNVDSRVRSVYEKHVKTLMAGEVDLNTALRLMGEEAQLIVDKDLKP